jgi:hypothetical protein
MLVVRTVGVVGTVGLVPGLHVLGVPVRLGLVTGRCGAVVVVVGRSSVGTGVVHGVRHGSYLLGTYTL